MYIKSLPICSPSTMAIISQIQNKSECESFDTFHSAVSLNDAADDQVFFLFFFIFSFSRSAS